MDDNNILVSNGTCYYAIDKESSDNVIPCGNVANGAYACCQEGDYCLEYNMCYNDNHTTTYMAGCTDPTFGASECPSKDHSDQQLLGLTQCDGTDTSDGNVLWSGCPGPATRTVLGQPSVCSCSGTADGLLYAPTSIAAVASLPTKIGETISFKKGHTPSWATAGSSMTTSVGGHSTIVASTPAPTSKPVSSSGGFEAEPLSTGAKAGIGIGAAALGLAALGLILWVATWCRRRHAEKSEGEKKSPDHPTSPDQHGLAILHQPTPGYYYSSEAGSITGSVPPSYNSPEWPASAGFKSELPTDCERRFRFELPAGNAAGKSEAEAEAAAQRASTPLLPMHESSAHYPKQGTLANAFVVPSNLSVTQPSQSQYHVSTSGGDTVATTAQTAPISELHG